MNMNAIIIDRPPRNRSLALQEAHSETEALSLVPWARVALRLRGGWWLFESEVEAEEWRKRI